MRKKICFVIGSRANYSSIKSVMLEVKKNNLFKIQLVTTASAVLEKFGTVSKLIEADGFKIDHSIPTLISGETPLTMAKSTGLGIIELSSSFAILSPDLVVVVGDRFEAMATTIAAAYNNICIAHTMGGEVSGTIDESIRHAITKFSHVHFPSNSDAKKRIIKMGEDPNFVFVTGCPRIDLVKDTLKSYKKRINLINNYLHNNGVGNKISINDKFLLVSHHPVTTEYDKNYSYILQILKAIQKIKIPVIFLWPNPDAGSDDISRAIRSFRENNLNNSIRFFKNLPVNIYISLMDKTECLIGNSSSGIREGAFIGTPVVNIGTRQNSRLRGQNVIDVPNDEKKIFNAIKKQLKHGKYKSDHIYGSGNAGKKITSILSKLNINIQKKINY